MIIIAILILLIEMNILCKICNKESQFEKINTYKYSWYYCQLCKNIFSEKKKEVFFEKSILKKIVIILSKIKKISRIKELFLKTEISGSEFYDYTDIINNKKFNKWDNYDDQFLKYLKDNEIDLTNKSILSISDEPGFIVKKIKNYSNNIILTALDEKTASLMSKKLSVETITYDFHKDQLFEKTNKKFDVIIYRSCLNFALDINKIVNEISIISNPNAVIVLNFHTPTLSSCLMWMFDDYTMSSFFNSTYVKNIFKKNKFSCVKEYSVTFNPRKHYYNSVFKKIFYYPFYFFYLLNFILDKKINKYNFKCNYLEMSSRLIFKKD